MELLPNGSTIKVTAKNRRDYCKRVAQFYLVQDMHSELKDFVSGFYSVIPSEIVSVFDIHELDFLLTGVPELNLHDWKQNTVYRGEFTATHKVVKWFWDILSSLSQAELRKFLLFCTGMPRVPIEGFRALQSNRNRTCKF